MYSLEFEAWWAKASKENGFQFISFKVAAYLAWEAAQEIHKWNTEGVPTGIYDCVIQTQHDNYFAARYYPGQKMWQDTDGGWFEVVSIKRWKRII